MIRRKSTCAELAWEIGMQDPYPVANSPREWIGAESKVSGSARSARQIGPAMIFALLSFSYAVCGEDHAAVAQEMTPSDRVTFSERDWTRDERRRTPKVCDVEIKSSRANKTGTDQDIEATLVGQCRDRMLRVFVWGAASCEEQLEDQKVECSGMCVSAIAFKKNDDPAKLFDRFRPDSATCSFREIPAEYPFKHSRLEVFRKLRVDVRYPVESPIEFEPGEETRLLTGGGGEVAEFVAIHNESCRATVSKIPASTPVKVRAALHATRPPSPPPVVGCGRPECTDQCDWTKAKSRRVHPCPPVPDMLTARQKFGIGLIAAGAAGVGLGVGLGAAALTKRSDSNKQCGTGVGFSDSDFCTADGVESNRTAQRFGTAAIVSLGVGVGAAAAGAALLWIWTGKADEVAAGQSRTFAVAPMVGGGASGLNIQTTW